MRQSGSTRFLDGVPRPYLHTQKGEEDPVPSPLIYLFPNLPVYRFTNPPTSLRPRQPRIERIAQAVTNVVERQHHQRHADGRRQE